jgi:hypothetical protein
MASITFNVSHEKAQVREWLSAILMVFLKVLNPFVGDRIRRATAQAEHVRRRKHRATRVTCAMVAMPFTYPEHSQVSVQSRAEILLDDGCSGLADESANRAVQFQPLDSAIVNKSIPAFFIGRNQDGFWVARDTKGLIGGLFLLESSAVSFAKRHSKTTGCATIYPSARFELDLENDGNPFVAQLASFKRLLARLR